MGLGIRIPKNVFSKGQEAFKEGDDFNNVDLDPGKHVCILLKGRAVDTKNGPQIVLDFKVAGESEQAGGRVSKFYGLTEEQAVWLFRDLAKLGYEVDELDEAQLEEILEDISKTTPVVRLTAKKAGDYVNLFIDKLLDDVSASEVEPAEAEEAEAETETEEEEVEEKPAKKAVAKKPLKVAKKAEPEAEEEEEPAEEEETEEDPSGDDDEVELKVGMKVTSASNKWKGPAKVVSIDEDKGIIKVKTAKGEVLKAKPDDIEMP
jgi:hypothetical protein